MKWSILPANGHLVSRQSASFVGADDGRATQSFYGRQGSYNGVLFGHTPGTQSQASRDYGGQTLGDSGYSESDGDFEIVDGALDPGSTVSRIVKVADVDGPHGDANHGDDLRQLLAELVQFLLQRRLDLLGLRHFRTNLTDGRVQTGSNDDTASLASGNVGTREQDVFLVLEKHNIDKKT